MSYFESVRQIFHRKNYVFRSSWLNVLKIHRIYERLGFIDYAICIMHGLQSRPPSPKRAERKVRRRPFREAGSGQNNGTR